MNWIVNPFFITPGMNTLTCVCDGANWYHASGEGCLDLSCGKVSCNVLQCGEPGTPTTYGCGQAKCTGFKGKCDSTTVG